MRKISVGLGLLAILVGLAAWLLKSWIDKPLFTPGSVRAGIDLTSPLDPPANARAAEGFFDVGGGIRLFALDQGHGTRALVVHGGPGIPFARGWTGLNGLTSRFAFLYYHQRGCGRSTRPIDRLPAGNPYQRMLLLHRTLGLPAQIGDIERLRRALGQEKIVLIGHSFGGFLAALYAAEFPERVRGLVLVCPAPLFVMPPPEGGLYEQIRPLLPAAQRAPYEAYLRRVFDFKAMLDSDETSLAKLNAEAAPFYAAAAQARGFELPPAAAERGNGGWMVPAMYLGLGRRHDWTHVAAGCKAPVLVLHGELDLQSEAATRSYARVFPQARFEVVKGSGHFPFEQQPQAFQGIVGAFLDQL